MCMYDGTGTQYIRRATQGIVPLAIGGKRAWIQYTLDTRGREEMLQDV